MIVTNTVTYWEHDVIPPRCRKPRDMQRELVIDVEVVEVAGEDAPVAFRCQPWNDTAADEWRWWHERLWKIYRPWSGQTEASIPGSEFFPAHQTLRAPYEADGHVAASNYCRKSLADYLIIDGIVYIASGEPRYEIFTLGLGHNHSSSGFGVREWFNGNIHRDRYFRADQYEECKAEAVRVALARGDTNSVPMIEREPAIEVLIPEAVRCDPATHGEGDPFLNSLYAISESSGSALEAGVLTVATTIKEIQ